MTASASTNRPRRPWRPRWRAAFVFALVLATAAAHDAAAQIAYSGSVRTATGSYLFTERTTSVYVLSALEVGTGPVRISASVPVIYQGTPWISYLMVPVPSGGPQSAGVGEQIRKGASGAGKWAGTGAAGPTTSNTMLVTLPEASAVAGTGVGDVIVRASYLVTPAANATAIRLHAAFKPGLASVSDGFGTGSSDYGVGVTLARGGGRQQVSGGAEFWNLGDMPGLPLNSTLSYRLAYDRFMGSSRWSASGAFSGWTTILDGVDPPMEVSLGVTRHFNDSKRSLGATASFGLTDSSPDVSVSLEWRLQL